MTNLYEMCLVALALICFLQPDDSRYCSLASKPREEEQQQQQQNCLERLGGLCKRIQSINTLSEMQELIDTLREAAITSSGKVMGTSSAPGSSSTERSSSSRWSLFADPFEICLLQASQIADLEPLIQERKNICSSQHIDKIERYNEKHIKTYTSRTLFGSLNSNKPITLKFFQLYATQVAFNCKATLLRSLKMAQYQVNEEDCLKVMPWLAESNTKQCQEIQLNAYQADPPMLGDILRYSSSSPTDEIEHCKARQALNELSNIDELVDVLESNEALMKNQEKADSASDRHSGLFLILPDNQRQVVGDILTSCERLKPVYEQTIMPVVRLTRMGYNPTFTKFDKVCSTSDLIKKWLGLTLVCNSMLNSRLPDDLEEYKTLINENQGKSLVIVDEVDGTVDNNTVDSDLDDIESHESQTETMIGDAIQDELWIQNYASTKLQRLRDNITRKVFKLFKVEDINSHIVFRRNTTNSIRWIVRVVLITLACSAIKN